MKEQLVSFETAKLAHEKGFGVTDSIHETKGCYMLEDCEIWQPDMNDHWKDEVKAGKYFQKEPELVEEYRRRWREIIAWSPTQSLLQKWLREEHDISIWVYPHYDMDLDQVIYKYAYMENNAKWNSKAHWDSHEEALEKGLQEALQLI